MSSHRNYSGWVALLLLVLSGLPALGQDHELRGMQLFEPADPRPYGNWAQPNTGFFLDFDGVFWHISPPDKTTIGRPDQTQQILVSVDPLIPPEQRVATQRSELETTFRAKWKQGDRIELGYMGEHHGWMITTLELNQQTQFMSAQNAPVVFNDPTFNNGNSSLLQSMYSALTDPDPLDPLVGPPLKVNGELIRAAVVFDQVSAVNRMKFQGVEASYLYRQHQLHHGATIEWLLGARYVQVTDDFQVNATGGNLANSFWENEVKNRIAGPEIGIRYFKPWGRFALSSEGRFMAGLNSQAVHLNGVLATTLNTSAPNNGPYQPYLMHATSFDHTANFYEFSPLVEFRVEAHMRITRNISAKAGWNAIWMDSLARAADMIDYTVDGNTGTFMPITKGIGGVSGYRQEMFMHGLVLGVEINR